MPLNQVEEYFDQNQVNEASKVGKPAASPTSTKTAANVKQNPRTGIAQIKKLALKKHQAKTKVDQVIQNVLKKSNGNIANVKPKTVQKVVKQVMKPKSKSVPPKKPVGPAQEIKNFIKKKSSTPSHKNFV